MPDSHPETTSTKTAPKKKWTIRSEPAVQFLLRGLAISLPSILTIVILIWVLNGVNSYIIQPTSYAVQWSFAQFVDESILTEGLIKVDGQPEIDYCGINYLWTAEAAKKLDERLTLLNNDANPNQENNSPKLRRREKIYQSQLRLILESNSWKENVFVPVGKRKWAVPYNDYASAAQTVSERDMPVTTSGVYALVVADRYLGGWFNLTLLMVSILIIALYFLGRLVTAQLGNWAVRKFEVSILGRLPLISNVYSSVKQVTDFLFTERTVEYSRVVAIEYPRKGIWSLGLVTGEGMIAVTGAAGEPMVSILIPSSPMPVTGYTMTIPRSAVIDLDISIDQAFQFCISCGVLVPDDQKVTPERLQAELTKRFTQSGQHIPISAPAREIISTPTVSSPPVSETDTEESDKPDDTLPSAES